MRRRFGTTYLREEFERLGAALTAPTDAYLVGGGSMAFRDLKDATKDVDLVIESRASLDRIRSALQSTEYDLVREPTDEYASLGAEAVLENDDGCRFDLFVRQVGGELVFSEAMRRRSEGLFESRTLAVRLVSEEDIFLFKSVAGRTDDIEDMFTLLQTGLDFDSIEDEIDRQVGLLGSEFFVTVINGSLIELEERFGATTPIEEFVADRTAKVNREIELLRALEGATPEGDLLEELGTTERDLEDLLDGLQEKGVIHRDGSEIERTEDRP